MKTHKYSNSIVLLEADSNYTILYKSDGSQVISSYHLAWHIERLCSEIMLIRANRKHCVNLQYLKAFNGDFLMMNHVQRQIPVSRRRKEYVSNTLEALKEL